MSIIRQSCSSRTEEGTSDGALYDGDYRADANPDMNQWCVMQAKECKRQADNCAAGIPAAGAYTRPLFTST